MTFFGKIIVIFVLGLVGIDPPMKADVLTVAPSLFSAPFNVSTMKRNHLPLREYLLNNYAYFNGELYKITLKSHVKCLIKSGHTQKDKYCTIRIGEINYFIHRVIFKMFTGEEPDCIDHINNNPSDNRIENLQALTHSDNLFKGSGKLRKHNTSGYKGVHYDKTRKKWTAFITKNRLRKHLGRYDDLKDAISSRQSAEKNYMQNIKQ